MTKPPPRFEVGDVVEYVGEGGQHLRPGVRGIVVTAQDYNGDAAIDFEGDGIGIWSPERQQELVLVRSINPE